MRLIMSEPLLQVRNLKTHFSVKGERPFQKNTIKAVDGVSFHVDNGETFGLVGESGCGKTTIGKTLLGLAPITSGEICFNGENFATGSKARVREVRFEMQMIFQDPYGSLDPRMNAERIIGEIFRIRGVFSPAERRNKVYELMEIVGLSPKQAGRFPHEFSGGQRQRIGIARALALNPKLVICDEPVSALDMSVQSQILNLLVDLKRQMGLTFIFIAHGLPVVKYISDRIGVMYLGKLVEVSLADQIYNSPRHPYTQSLISAVPVPDPDAIKNEIILEGDVPSPVNPPTGCRFHTRCPYRRDICSEKEPEMIEESPGHFAACHFSGQL
jgi:oligopeptide transport system ATP-binding protein